MFRRYATKWRRGRAVRHRPAFVRRAAQTLAQPEAMAELKEFLARDELYIFTLNGFPYGTFHGKRVKEDVYLPDWRDERAPAYTRRTRRTCWPSLLPRGQRIGSISTVPGAFKPNASTPEAVARIVQQLIRHVAHLVGVDRGPGG